MRSRLVTWIALAGALAAAGCSDPEEPCCGLKPTPIITVSPATATVAVGQTVSFNANVQNDTTGPMSGYTWSSDSVSIATVNSEGVVTGVRQGVAVIRARSTFKPNLFAAAQVTVTAPPTSSLTPYDPDYN